MYKVWKSIFNGNWVEGLINNFDPYGVKEFTEIELNKKYNENQNSITRRDKNGKLGKD